MEKLNAFDAPAFSAGSRHDCHSGGAASAGAASPAGARTRGTQSDTVTAARVRPDRLVNCIAHTSVLREALTSCL